MAIQINGDGTITGISSGGLPAGSVTSATLASGAITSGAMPSGSVLQVLQAVKTDTQSLASSATPVDITGLSITITPASSSSKFYITGKVCLCDQNYTQNIVHLNVNGSNVGQPVAAGSRISGHTGMGYVSNEDQYAVNNVPVDFLVNASDGNAHTIKIQWSQADTVGNDSKTIYCNRSLTDENSSGAGSRYISTLTVMEIAA